MESVASTMGGRGPEGLDVSYITSRYNFIVKLSFYVLLIVLVFHCCSSGKNFIDGLWLMFYSVVKLISAILPSLCFIVARTRMQKKKIHILLA